jgi:hypothetical protein
VDPILEKVLNFGGLGVGLFVAWLIAKHYDKKLEALQARMDATVKEAAVVLNAYRDAHEIKGENWAKHLSELSLKNQENDVKITALLEAILRTRAKKHTDV